ncbi:MAG: hypothetical protein KatS3mg129_0821 [Leptospiraceae bacterium]|nr:MAG: hypothetical protein KatS3mg129_0821 [Leptospiraceae bacterium]
MKSIHLKVIFFIIFIIGINILNSEPIIEEKSLYEKQNINKQDPIKDIENDWLKELKKETDPSNTDKNQTVLQNEEKEKKEQENQTLFGESPSFIGIFIRFVLILGIFGISFYYVIQYFKRKNLILSDSFSPIQVLASIPIMSGKFLQIVDVAGQIMILGVSENNINLIQIVENSLVAEKIRLWHEEYKKKQMLNQFQLKDILNKIFGNQFSFWHNEEKQVQNNKNNFYSYLNNQPSDNDVKWEDLEELLEIQKEKLKRFKKQQ